MSIIRTIAVLFLITAGLLGKNRLRLEKADLLENKTINGEIVQYCTDSGRHFNDPISQFFYSPPLPCPDF